MFLNSDTVVPSGWLDELLAPFEMGDVGAVGPRSDNVSGKQKAMAVPDPQEDPRAFVEFAESWRTSHRGQTSEARRLIGFCLAVRTSSFRALGGFDERFEIGGFEDDDLCRRLHQSKLRLLIAHGSFVHHRGHASFDANDIDWRVTQAENQVRFEAKWGADALRKPVLVTACLIVKNEEQMLGGLLGIGPGRRRRDRGLRHRLERPHGADRPRGRCHGRGRGMGGLLCGRPERRAAARHRGVGVVHRRRRATADPSRRPAGPARRPSFGCRGLSRRDREPARAGQSALRPHGDPDVPAAFGDMAASAARAGCGRRRSRPATYGPPTCRGRG